MQLYLVRNARFEFGPPHSYKVNFSSVEQNALMIHNNNGILPDKLAKALRQQFGEKDWPLAVGICSPENPGPGPDNTVKVGLRGEILKALQQFINGEDSQDKLDIELEANRSRDLDDQMYYDRDERINTHPVCLFKTRNLSPKMEENGDLNLACYLGRAEVEIHQIRPQQIATYPRDGWEFSIKISAPGFIDLDDILPKAGKSNRQIFENRKLYDFTIISGDGTRVPCHKVFLAKSPVLLAMLDGDYEEVKKNEMTMKDMTTRGINALLEYLYCDDVKQAISQADMAFELLKAAEKYDLPILWKAMDVIILAKPHTWFDVDLALNLFIFVGQCQRWEDRKLKKKLVQVLAMKPIQLSKSSLYAEMCSNSAMKDLFEVALEANRP